MNCPNFLSQHDTFTLTAAIAGEKPWNPLRFLFSFFIVFISDVNSIFLELKAQLPQEKGSFISLHFGQKC